MRKMVCPQCKVGAFFVMNGQGERLPVYISDKGEIVPKDGTSSLEGYDQDTVYCLCCSWRGTPKRWTYSCHKWRSAATGWYNSIRGPAYRMTSRIRSFISGL